MTGRNAMRWIAALATIVVLVAIVIGAAVVVAWTSLSLEHATVVIDGETIALPSLTGGQAALALMLAVFAVLVTAIVVVGAVVVALVTVLIGVAIVALVAVVTLLLAASPLLLVGWLIWRLARSPSGVGTRAQVA